jgi:hypothetical protein
MADEHSELQKALWSGLASVAGMLIGQCIVIYVHAFRDHGFKAAFKAAQWDGFFVHAIAVFSALIVLGLVMQHKEVTTLGIGGLKAKKLR